MPTHLVKVTVLSTFTKVFSENVENCTGII